MTGATRTADVIARTPVRLLRLDRATWVGHAAQLVHAERVLARTAAERGAATLNHHG